MALWILVFDFELFIGGRCALMIISQCKCDMGINPYCNLISNRFLSIVEKKTGKCIMKFVLSLLKHDIWEKYKMSQWEFDLTNEKYFYKKYACKSLNVETTVTLLPDNKILRILIVVRIERSLRPGRWIRECSNKLFLSTWTCQ